MKRKLFAAMAVSAFFAGMTAIPAYAAGEMIQNPDGTASFVVDGIVQTGAIVSLKDYNLGDVGGDDCVDSLDAAQVLYSTALAGAGGDSAADILAENSDFLPDAAAAVQYADVNADSRIDAMDAADILLYAAEAGTELAPLPLGAEQYFADAQGKLRQGLITDDSGIYFAGEDYRLCRGWISVDGQRYYFGRTASALTGWQQIGGKRYYFGNNGAMAVGWQEIDSERYYFTAEGNPLISWQTLGGERYYFNAQGMLQTGWQQIGTHRYYFAEDGVMQSGWLTLEGRTYYLNEEGKLLTGWREIDGNKYYFNANGIMYTGLVTMEDGKYYFGTDGILRTGVQVIDGNTCYFDETGKLRTGWITIDGDTYYYDETGNPYTGWLETDKGNYYFRTDGTMLTGFTDLGSGMVYFEPDGRYYGKCKDITAAKTTILENAELNPHDSYIIWNRQVSPEKQYMKITLKDKDVAILEQFAQEHFTEDMTMAQKLWITQQWIHKKVDYAYAGSKWNSIVNLSYVEAIFVNRMGQCVQYNGAMAAMMIWFGYDVYMVKGWTDTGNQHFWTEVVIDGKTYLMECGNYGKNGNWHDFLEPLD